jgi:phage shock protein PspC (stress-responsive transcriptional regulator)
MAEKRLTRSRHDRMIAGVAAGVAKYFDLDPALIRIVFVILLLAASGGFWIYLLLWIVMPEE